MLGDTGNKQAVRILLEYILVQINFIEDFSLQNYMHIVAHKFEVCNEIDLQRYFEVDLFILNSSPPLPPSPPSISLGDMTLYNL